MNAGDLAFLWLLGTLIFGDRRPSESDVRRICREEIRDASAREGRP